MTEAPIHPLETVPEDEAAAIAKLQKMQLLFMKRDESQRGQHPKSTGCVHLGFSVRPDVPDEFRHGVFAEPRSYEGLARFSNGGGLDDRERDARGIALKILGVEGERLLPGEAAHGNFDLLLVNCPTFFCQSAAQLLGFMQAQLKARGEPPTEWLRAHPGPAAAFERFVSPPPPSLLDCDFHSTTPYLLQDRAVKYALYPAAPVPTTSAPVPDSEDRLRVDLFARLEQGDARFIFGVHTQTDPRSQPVEDSTVEWKTPFVPLAEVTIPRGQSDSPARRAFAERLVYSPWRAPAVHRPLGGINRARLPVYAASSAKRHDKTGATAAEPTSIDELP